MTTVDPATCATGAGRSLCVTPAFRRAGWTVCMGDSLSRGGCAPRLPYPLLMPPLDEPRNPASIRSHFVLPRSRLTGRGGWPLDTTARQATSPTRSRDFLTGRATSGAPDLQVRGWPYGSHARNANSFQRDFILTPIGSLASRHEERARQAWGGAMISPAAAGCKPC